MTADQPTDRQEDLRLARLAARGDRSAFHALIEQVSPKLLRTARGLCRSQADAEDVVQETLLESYKSLRTYDGKARLLSWMTRILVRRAHRAWAREKKDPRPMSISAVENETIQDASMIASGSMADVDRRLDLASILAELAPEHREVLVLRELQGMSYSDIASALNIAGGTVESRLFRARAALRERLTRYDMQVTTRRMP